MAGCVSKVFTSLPFGDAFRRQTFDLLTFGVRAELLDESLNLKLPILGLLLLWSVQGLPTGLFCGSLEFLQEAFAPVVLLRVLCDPDVICTRSSKGFGLVEILFVKFIRIIICFTRGH